MIDQYELEQYLNKFLDCENYHDYAPNGLQVEGKQPITTLCTAVSACQESVDKAYALKAQALLVHHGYFWKAEPTAITGLKYRRLSQLIDYGLSLFGYHLPLDGHLTLGNNAYLANLLEIEQIKTHKINGIPNILWSGELKKCYTAQEFIRYVYQRLHRKPQHIATNANSNIKRIAWCSGAAQDFIIDVAQLKVDAYLSGEISERTYHQAKELDIHYFAAGHHATEKGGIISLGNHLARSFDLKHYFIDSNNPV